MDDEQQIVELAVLPVWKGALAEMRKNEITYGKVWLVEYFEKWFRCARDTTDFDFAMLALRQVIEEEDGYYMKSLDNGRQYYIVMPGEVEGVASGFEKKSHNLKVRSVKIRRRTLSNEKAELTDEERKTLEAKLAIAENTLCLIGRQDQINALVQAHNPALLPKMPPPPKPTKTLNQ